MNESLKIKTFKGTLWTAFESFSTQGVLFIVMIIMARILTPADYGLVGMLGIFIAISQSIINSGFTQALVRKQDRTEVDNSSVFYFNILLSVTLYFVLYFCAPLIADFYDTSELTQITRLVGLTLIIQSFALVQKTLLTAKLDFKTQAKATFSSSLVSGIVGISLAYSGWGVWAIVIQQLTNGASSTILLWIMSKWKPSFLFSWKSLKSMFAYGSRIEASSLINSAYNNIYGIVIGKLFKAADLGYYSRANSFSDFGSSNLTSILQRVSYPVLCTIQNEDDRLASVYSRLLRTSCFIIFPVMVGLASVSKPFIETILTAKWEYSAILLVPICFAQMWYPVHSINLNLLQVKGRSDLFLRLEIIKKILGIAILCGTAPFGLYFMCWGLVLSSLIALIINTHYTGKLINLGIIKQMWDLLPILLLSLVMGAIVWITVTLLPFPQQALLTIGVLEGVSIYLLGAKLFHFPEFAEISDLLKRNKS